MSVINPAHQFLKMPKSKVGTYALDLADLASKEIPLPVTYCLPVSTLEKIAKHNWLDDKFDQITSSFRPSNQLQAGQALSKVRNLIRQQTIPKEVSHKLFEFYQQRLNQDFIRLTASPVRGFETEYKREDNIQGEANMMDSILKLWARNITPRQLTKQNLFPIAIVIQSQAQPKASGLAFSQNPANGDKTQITIHSTWGVYQSAANKYDRFYIDQRNWQIVEQKISSKEKYLQRKLDQLKTKKTAEDKIDQPSLDTEQIQELAKLVKKIKLKKINQVRLHWSLRKNGKILITKIKPFHFTQNDQQTKNHQVIALGQSITNGYLSGQAQLVTTNKELKQFKAGNIAVVDELTLDHQILLETSSGIICQQGIKSQTLLKKIRRYQIPVIAFADHALKRIKNHQTVIVDAGAGKIYERHQQQRHSLEQTALTKLYLAVNQPEEINPELNKISSGIGLIRSEHFFIPTGYHPIKLIKTQRKKLKQKISHQIINFYHRYLNLKNKPPLLVYRSLNLTTNQLLKLSKGPNFETEETNPYLGFRGASRFLNQPEIFNFELELIAHINKKIDKPIILLLPFVRTAFEWQHLLLHIKKEIKQQVLRPQVWLQLSTPENIFNFEQYLDSDLAGISINLKSIHALMHGIDPDFPDIFNQYQLDNQLIAAQLKKVKQILDNQSRQIQAVINLHQFNQDIVEQTASLKFDGITVRPKIAKQVKQQLIEKKRKSS